LIFFGLTSKMGLGKPVESLGSMMAKDLATSSAVANGTVSESAEGVGSSY
jgi:hypothetical protein